MCTVLGGIWSFGFVEEQQEKQLNLHLTEVENSPPVEFLVSPKNRPPILREAHEWKTIVLWSPRTSQHKEEM